MSRESGHKICVVRISLGFSQEYVAHLALGHTTGSYLSKIERGLIEPDPAVISRILAVLGIIDAYGFLRSAERSCVLCRRVINVPWRKRGVPSHYYEGSLFCASGMCPDTINIPRQCPELCIPGEDVFDSCPPELQALCPCASPTTPERDIAFQQWLSREVLAKH